MRSRNFDTQGIEKAAVEVAGVLRAKPSNRTEGLDYATLREIRFLSSLDHPHILKSEELICSRKDYEYHLYMVLEFMLELPKSLRNKPELAHEESLRLIAYHVLLGL